MSVMNAPSSKKVQAERRHVEFNDCGGANVVSSDPRKGLPAT